MKCANCTSAKVSLFQATEREQDIFCWYFGPGSLTISTIYLYLGFKLLRLEYVKKAKFCESHILLMRTTGKDKSFISQNVLKKFMAILV